MARFMVTAMPFTGHVTPILAIAEALVARGHDVEDFGTSPAEPVLASPGRVRRIRST